MTRGNVGVIHELQTSFRFDHINITGELTQQFTHNELFLKKYAFCC